MTITQSETGLGTTDYNNLLQATADLNIQAVIYRQNPSFDNYLGYIGGRDVKTPFSAAADSTLLIRAFNESGSIKAEVYSSGSWASAVTIDSGQIDVAPKIIKNGSTWEVYYLGTDGKVYKSTSAAGVTWSAGSAYSTVTLTPALVKFMSVALGAIPLVYIAQVDANETMNIVALDATTQYDTGVYWANKVYEMDAIHFIAEPDDTSGINSDTNARHCLTLAALLPNSYTYKTVAGLPVKEAQPAGGVISFIIRPPNGSRPIQTSRWYPVQTFDEWDDSLQNRKSAKVMATSSLFDGSNSHDTLWITSVGFDGDKNLDSSYAYPVVAYYSSRDGKHWSQDRIIPLSSGLGISDGDFVKSAVVVQQGTNLYLLSPTALVHSDGCLEFNNTPSSLILDVTHRLVSYSSSAADMRSSSIVLDNADNGLWETFLADPGVYSIIVKVGQGSNLVQIAVEEIDSIGPVLNTNGGFSENVQISTRDRMAWLVDRVESAHAIQWDNQLSYLDTFSDINGTTDSGLAHTDTVKGVFSTADNKLIGKAKYRENIGFHTTGSGQIQDGHAGAIFEIPTPTSFGGTNASDSPTYVGVLFRAIDKDNFWAVWYNFWTGKIELVERNSGVDTIRHSITPTSAFKTRADSANTVGLRVEFKGATVNIYESTVLYSAIGARYNPSYTYTVAKSSTSMLMGYVGYITCAYSDEDEGDNTDPGPIIAIEAPSDWGVRDSFLPSRYYTVDYLGNFFYGAGAIGSPSWTDLSPGSTIQNNLINGSGNAQFDFIADPYHLHRFIMLGDDGIAKNDNVHSLSWTQTSHAPLSGNHWCAFHQYPYWGTSGDIQASINWEGYFCWLEFDFGGGSGNHFCYTHDNFATIHRTSLATWGFPYEISLGQRASNWNNIYVVISFNCGVVAESTNGGQTFTTKAIPTGPGFPCTGNGDPWWAINVPYTLGGGAANTTNKSVMTLSFDTATPFKHHFLDLSGTWRTINPVTAYGTSIGRSRSINTLTVDGNYINMRIDANVWRSSDGGATWTHATVGGTSSYPSYASRLNGWPTNPDVGIMPDQGLRVTLDGFATQISLNPGGLSNPINNAIADLTEVYDIGGVH
jgi:hypothetical protein